MYQSWDRELLAELSALWEARGYIHDNGPGAMTVHDCATAVVAAITSPVDLRYVSPTPRRARPWTSHDRGREVPESLPPLGPWLAAHLDGVEAVELLGIRRASSGFSADTTMVDVAVTRGGIADETRYVLRTESPDPPVYPVQVPGWSVEIELQYRMMEALGRHSAVPVAPDDRLRGRPAVLGAQFFVMGYVDGQVPVEDPPYTTAGFFLDLRAGERRRMIERGLATVARRARRRLARRGTRLARAAGGHAGHRDPARPLGALRVDRAA